MTTVQESQPRYDKKEDIVKSLAREKIVTGNNLSTIWPEFYDDVALSVAMATDNNERDNMIHSANRFTNSRISKIVRMASLSPLSQELAEKLSAEEQLLYNGVFNQIQFYRNAIAKKIQG